MPRVSAIDEEPYSGVRRGVKASVVRHFSLFSRRLTFSFIQARDSGVGPTVGMVAGLSFIDEGSERGIGDGRSSSDCY